MTDPYTIVHDSAIDSVSAGGRYPDSFVQLDCIPADGNPFAAGPFKVRFVGVHSCDFENLNFVEGNCAYGIDVSDDLSTDEVRSDPGAGLKRFTLDSSIGLVATIFAARCEIIR